MLLIVYNILVFSSMKKQYGGRIVKPPDTVYCAPAGKKGRGIFAAKNIKNGAVIEECEVIYFSKKEIPDVQKTQLDNYYYCWRGGGAVLPLGFGLLYNHSQHPNAEWRDDYKNRRQVLWATRTIKKDEEITVNYDPGSNKMWFPVVEDGGRKPA